MSHYAFSTVDYDVNANSDEEEQKAPDMVCPDIGTKQNNYWKDKCLARQKNPTLNGTCYPQCKYTKKVNPEQPKRKTIPTNTRRGTMREKIANLYRKKYSVEEISQKLNTPTHNVRTNLSKARRFGEL